MTKEPAIFELNGDVLRKLREAAEGEKIAPEELLERLIERHCASKLSASDRPARPAPMDKSVLVVVAKTLALGYRGHLAAKNEEETDDEFDEETDGPLAQDLFTGLVRYTEMIEADEPDPSFLDGMLLGIAIVHDLDEDAFEDVSNALDAIWIQAHKNVCAEWIETHGLKSKHKLGDTVHFEDRGQTFAGEVREIDNRLGYYHVWSGEYERLVQREDGEERSVLYLLPFEQEKPNPRVDVTMN